MNQTFFEPSTSALSLYKRFNEPVKDLVEEWWERIETSSKFADNEPEIRQYQQSLTAGAITLVGLVAEGAQGMRTGNNARFLGYLEGTVQAQTIEAKRETWTWQWLSNPTVKEALLALLVEAGGESGHPTRNVAAWEACVEPLKAQFDARRDLGLSRTDLYRVVPRSLVALPEDFAFAFERRKAQLIDHWRSER